MRAEVLHVAQRFTGAMRCPKNMLGVITPDINSETASQELPDLCWKKWGMKDPKAQVAERSECSKILVKT